MGTAQKRHPMQRRRRTECPSTVGDYLARGLVCIVRRKSAYTRGKFGEYCQANVSAAANEIHESCFVAKHGLTRCYDASVLLLLPSAMVEEGSLMESLSGEP